MRNISGKRILSLLLVLTMLVGMFMVPVSADSRSELEKTVALTVYRDPSADYSQDGLLALKRVTSETKAVWISEISKAAFGENVTDADIRYWVSTNDMGWTDLSSVLWGSWFGHNAVMGGTAKNPEHEDVLITYGNETKRATVTVKGYVDIEWNWIDENGIAQKKTEKVDVGTTPTAPAIPATAKNAQYTYTLDANNNWTPAVDALTVANATALDNDNYVVVYNANYTTTTNKYDVVFDTKGGSAVPTQSIEYGSKATKPADPTKDNFVFAGWYADPNYGAEFDFNMEITQPTTVYAKWNEKFTVSFDTNGGTPAAIDSQTVEFGKKATKPADPEKTGHSFTGWFEAGATAAFDFDTAIEADTALTAGWAANSYKVAFDTKGGSTVAEQTIEYNKTAAKPADPAKEGHTFNGWYTDADCKNAFDFSTAITGNITLYADWTLNTYPVTWYDEDGTTVLATATVNHGETPVFPADGKQPFKQGWNFNGWNPEMGPVTSPNGAAYYATYTQKNTYNVIWANTELDPTPVVDGEKVTKPADPSKAGHTFGGWYADPDFTKAFDFNAAIMAETTAYAMWTANKYTVSFNTNGGGDIAAQTIEYNKTAAKPADPTKTGYTFAGWYKDEALQTAFNFADAIVDDITLYANWTINKYTVSFNSNGGSDVAPQTIEYNKTATKPVDPTMDGHAFAGWYGDKALEVPYNFNDPVTGSTTLFAKWTANKYTVSFQTNGGTAIDPQTVEYKESATKPAADPTLPGYSFGGWYADEDCTKAFDFSMPITDNTTVYAQWKINQYKVIFNADNNTDPSSVTVDHGKTVSEPAKPVKTGFTFMGWFLDGATSAYDFSTPVTADITLTAQWKKDPVPTRITANTPAPVTYGYDAAALKAAIGAVVIDTETGRPVPNAAVTYSPSLDNLPAGEYDVTVKFAATNDYLASSTTIKVTVNKAAAPTVSVASQTIKFGQAFEVADPISTTPNVKTIDFVAGLDVHDETNLLGLVQVGFEIPALAKAMIEAKFNCDLENLTFDQFMAIMAYLADNIDSVGALVDGIDRATVDKVIETLKTYKEALPVNTELKISVLDNLVLPTNVGVYLVGAVTADNNYETALGAGYLVITPNGMKVDLEWNYNDANGILTIPAFKTGAFDLTAKATLIESTLDGAQGTAEEAAKHIEYIYIGVDADGELILSRTLDLNSRAGIYAEVAYVANWDNAMYYAVPIARTLLLAPGVADVAFIDVNGNKNYAQAFDYDGTPKPMTAVVSGGNGNGTLTVKYIGIDGHAEGYNRTEAPTESGLYAVVATYTEYADGKLEIVGGAVGALMIEQVEPGQFAFEKAHSLYEFKEGVTHFPTILSDLNYDRVTLAIDRENNIAYITLPADMSDHIAKLPDSVQAKIAELVGKIQGGDVQMSTIKGVLNDAIDQLIALNMEAKAAEVIDKAIDEISAELDARIDVDALKAKLDAEINKLKQSVKDKLPEEIASKLEEYIDINSGNVDVDVEGLKTELKAMIAKFKDVLPAEAVAELEKLIDTVVSAVNGNAQVNEIKNTVKDIVAKLEALEVPETETLVKALIGAVASKIDPEEVKSVINTVIDKVKAQEVLDEAVALVKDVAGIYGGKIDTTAVETTVKALIEKIKAKAESGQLDSDDLANLEIAVDEIFASLKTVVDQLPEGTIVAGNPSKVGVYDCYAINISANYKPTFIQSKMTIYNPGEIILTPNDGEFKYDGKEKSAEGFETLTFTINGAVYTVSGVTASVKATDAGEYPVVITGTPVVTDAQGKDVTSQFTVKINPAKLVITKRDVTLTSASDTKKYDGEALKNAAVTVSGDGFAANEGADYTVTGAQTEVGTSSNTFTYTLWTNTKAANYNITVALGTLEVTEGDKEPEKEPEVIRPMIPTAAIVVSFTEGGIVSNPGRNIVVYGTEHTFNVKPADGFQIADVRVNGVSIGAVDSITVRARTRVTTIDVTFAPVQKFPFIDVAPNEWYYDDVKYVWEKGLMNGTAGDAFSPLASTTRAMIVTILWRLEGSPVMQSAADFFDVEANVWYSQAISWASANGIVNGYGNGLFGPMDNITREQVAAIFCRYAAYKGIDTSAKAELGKDIKYTPWAADVLGWAEAIDLYDVVDRNTNDRTAAADRAEIAAYLRCLCEIVK